MQEILVGLLILAAVFYLVRRFVRIKRKHAAVSVCAGCLGCPAAMEGLERPPMSHLNCPSLPDQSAKNQPSPNSSSLRRPPLTLLP